MHSLNAEEIPFTTNLSTNATYGSLADLQSCTRNILPHYSFIFVSAITVVAS